MTSSGKVPWELEDIRACNHDIWQYFLATDRSQFQAAPGYGNGYQPTLNSPLRFIDRHLSPELTLKRVVLVDSLAHDLDDAIRPEFWNFLKDNDIFPPKYELPAVGNRSMSSVNEPRSLRRNYHSQIGRFAEVFASKLYVHPNQTSGESVFGLLDYSTTSQYLHEANLFILTDASEEDFGDFNLEKEVAEKVEPSTTAKLKHLRDKYEGLASFHFLPPCPASERIITEVALFKPEDWLASAVESPITLPTRMDCKPLDSPAAWWSRYGSYGQPQAKVQVEPKSAANRKKTVWIPPHCSRRNANYKPETSHFLQRAWCRAVENDATFTIIHDGNQERIGIRQRSTNTLFVSSVISPLETGYMRLHFSLYAAIVKDALERTRVPGPEVTENGGRKRKQVDALPTQRRSKRLKGEAAAGHSLESLFNEIASRGHTLLVSFNFGAYRSPAPSAFLRTLPSCHPDFISQPFPRPKANAIRHLSKCLHFIANEKIGHGATGTVHRGTIQLWTDSGATVEENAVIKIPLGTICTPSGHLSDNKEPYAYRVPEEYHKYETIFKGGVKFGVPKVHGVFQDVETGTVALL
ncbi:hypothetical protein CVT24_010935 [Panaeolus cyanescens]|uniref:Uncharacterized protein n=1 Tax=Panaeolus cyanescens TaxID=181874 RepID=A0A409WDH8_9AGAR|nr:hypothetical protein CVT24_010935 [Panaeolus cyanescens]